MPTFDEVELGLPIPARTFPVTREHLVRYAGASGDFNLIHWNERVALEVGLPGVIAHGMFTMAEVGRYVTDWAGDPGAVVRLGTRFSRPVVVPDDGQGSTITVTGKVEAKNDDGTVTVAMIVTTGDGDTAAKVLSGAKAVVRLARSA